MIVSACAVDVGGSGGAGSPEDLESRCRIRAFGVSCRQNRIRARAGGQKSTGGKH